MPVEIAEPVCELIFEQIVIVLSSELTVSSYLIVSSVIIEAKAIFYPPNRFWEIAKPRSDFNHCYERISENHNCILFIAVSL